MNREEEFRKEFINLYSEINLSSLLSKIAVKVRNYLNCQESSIFIYEPLREELFFEIATGEKENELKKIVLKKGEGVAGWIAEKNRSVIINDCSKDVRFTSVTDLKTNFKTRSILGVPVRMDNKLLGVMEGINKKDCDFNQEDKKLLEYISNFIAIPLQNALLFKKVIQETKEKDRLIELGKTISYSLSLGEVFKNLKDIIAEIIDPLELNVMVSSQNKVYQLITNEVRLPEKKYKDHTAIDLNRAVFPLKTRNKDLGFFEVKAKKMIPEEILSLIKGLAVFAAISIEKHEMFADIIEKEKIEKELHIAKQIQQSFLLNKRETYQGMDVSFVNIPSSEVGGDYYDIVKLDDKETIFTINDISGHGIPASLLMSIFRTNFVYRIKKDRDILTTIKHLNALIAETTDTNLYVTSFTLMVNSKKKIVKYINGGHVSPLLFREDEVIELKESSLVLGMFSEVDFKVAEIGLRGGDFLVLFTDGIVEAENSEGEQYSIKRLVDFVSGHRELETDLIKDKLIEELKKFTGEEYFQDDITFILIKIL